MSTRNSKAQFPEIRDFLLEELGWADEAKRVGFNRLPTRVVGTIGGLTNKMMVELAEKDISSETSTNSMTQL